MAGTRKRKQKKPSLEDRFEFIGDAVAPGDRAALRSALFEVVDLHSGADRSLKLWRKTGTPADDDLRQLWLHEMRQVQRVMSYAGARETIVDVLEFVEDDANFGMLLERVGEPLREKRKRASRQHWLRNLGASRARTLFWQNIKRVVTALGIIHAQGLIHGSISSDSIMTDGADEADFRLGGFEWSLWLSADLGDRSYAQIGPTAAVNRAESYSFEGDWRALGLLAAECLQAVVKASGDVLPMDISNVPMLLNVSERVLLRRLVAPARIDQLDAESLCRAIDDLIVSVTRSVSTRAGSFLMTFDRASRPGKAVYDATNGGIPIDEHRRQLEWVQGDLDSGATLLVPRIFDPGTSGLRLITNTMIYKLQAFPDAGSAVWDVAVCHAADVRDEIFSLGDNDEHAVLQPVIVAANFRDARERRGRLGPDVLDWSALAGSGRKPASISETDTIRRALLLLQTVEALVKALEVYPVEVLDRGRREGRRFVVLRAEPNSDRDRIAKRVGLSESAVAFKRLFEDEQREAEAKWRLSQAASLGATRVRDVVAGFVDVIEHRGRRAYQFEIDEDLAADGPFFLRTERDTGTEQVISRRLRSINALDTRVDLAEMLADPWRVRRSSREDLNETSQQDAAFRDLDQSKQEALLGIWSTLPSFFVVGPPGVGKTKLATEVIRRRFATDRSTRMLVSAQGHDALDNLQVKINETLLSGDLTDILVVRSTTPERRATSDEDVHRVVRESLERLSRSDLGLNAPVALRGRLTELQGAARRLERVSEAVERDHRSGLGALSSLVLDAANIVISTANSSDIERLVEAREQFDWVVIEEASKATGPELIGPLMLSGRRLLIGDHHQLPPFEADRLVKILSDHSLVSEALVLAEQFVGALLRVGDLEELGLIAADAEGLRDLAGMALRLLEPFRSFVEDDERRALANPGHRRIAATLTEQRRMDPAIAEIVSKTFYGGRLTTEANRVREAEAQDSPIIHLGALPNSPVVVVNFPHVSASGQASAIERDRPRWHNPAEVSAVIDVLRLIRPREGVGSVSLAILSPYKAQVEKLQEGIFSARSKHLSHLDRFVPVRGSLIGTVDSFQGSEADLVILSLVRNNPRTGAGALGFLRDRRRMNVALSRAKSQLIIVGSLSFLREAVRGVNPDAENHDLSFLTEMADVIDDLACRKRNGVPLANFVNPSALKAV
jgi:hypothetical protein